MTTENLGRVVGYSILSGAGVPSGGLGDNGDSYLNSTNGDVYSKVGGSWSITGNIKGIQGEQGEQGIQGEQGVQGEQGIQGIQGEQGFSILSGAGAPTTQGVNGDSYLDTTNGDTYLKSGGSWGSPTGNIKGIQGDKSDATRSSTTSNSIAIGSKTFDYATTPNIGWIVGSRLRAYNSAGNYMSGVVTDVSGTSVTILIDYIVGSGTYTSWNIGVAGDVGPVGVTTPNLPALTLAGNPTGASASPQGLLPIGMTIGSDGKFYNAVESGAGNLKVVRVKNPLGGALKGSPTETGAIRIKLPTNADIMFHISGGIYFYDTTSSINRSCRFSITCYGSSMANGYSAVFTGRKAPNFPVRFYTDGTNRYIYIGDLSQTYINAGLSITDVEAYFAGTTIPLISSGWEVTLETAFVGTLNATSTDNLPQSNQQQIISDFVVGANLPALNSDSKTQRDGKFQGQINERIPYTGATKAVDLGAQQLSLGGNFIKGQNTFEQTFLWPGVGSTNFREIDKIAVLSKTNDTSNIGDIIITLPIKTTTRWVTEILISDRIRTAKILVQAEGVSSTSKYCALIHGNAGFITEVKFGRDVTNNNTVLIIKRDTGTSTFSYGKVVISKFYHAITFDAALEVKSNYKVEFLDEATLTGITSIVSVTLISQLTNAGSALNLYKADGTTQPLATLPAFTATKFATPRNINGVAFDGSADITIADATKIPTTQKGAANGVVPLNASSLIDSQYLPAFVDDVIEAYKSGANFYKEVGLTTLIVGETGKIYVDLTTGQSSKQYRWSGSAYIQITNGLIASTNDVPEGTSLYFTVARVLASVLTGIGFSSAIAVTATDTILVAIGKLQAQINAIFTTLDLKAPIRYGSIVPLATATNLALAHENAYLRITATMTYTVVPNATIAFPINGRIDILVLSGSVLTIAEGAGVTITKKTSLVVTGYGAVTLIKTGTNTWDLIGN